ncbi:MAG TPA: hypothetical protein PLK98_06405 [Methanothrix sp.]|nr:hypothetical protein [Methanothrix sp.]
MTPEELDRLKYDLSYKLGLWSNSKHEQQLREFVYQLITHIDAQAVQISDLTAKYEDQIAGLQICIRIRDVRNYELVAQIAALKEKLLDARRTLAVKYPSDYDSPRWEQIDTETRQQLAQEMKDSGATWAAIGRAGRIWDD